MHPLLNTLLILGAAYLWIRAVMLLTGTSRIIKLVMRPPRLQAVERAEMGPLQPLFQPAELELLAQGFQYAGTVRSHSFVVGGEQPDRFFELYFHPVHNFHALVQQAETPSPVRMTSVWLADYFTDGSVTYAFNTAMYFPLPPCVQVKVSDLESLPERIAEFLERRYSAKARLLPGQVLARETELAATMFEQMVHEGTFYRRGDLAGVATGDEPLYGMRLWPALRYTWRVQLSSAKVRKRDRQAMKSAPMLTPAQQTALAIAQRDSLIRTLSTLHNLKAPAWLQRVGLGLTVPLFVAVGSLLWDWKVAIYIGAVVAFHEGGHWLAMKLSGFRDVQVFLVPGFGGATVGQKHEARPLTLLLVYLAGPVPGLLISALFFAGMSLHPEMMQGAWYRPAAGIATASLFINLFNLLPFMPLDGGRVVDLFVFARFPWLRFLFNIASALAILAYGYWQSVTVFYVLGGLLMAGSLFQYRLARASSLLQREVPQLMHGSHEYGATIRTLVDFVIAPRFAKWTYFTRLNLVNNLLPRVLGGWPGWRTSLAGVLIYLAALAAPFGVVTLALHDKPGRAALALASVVQRLAGIKPEKYDPQDALAMARARRASMLHDPDRNRFDAFETAIDDALEYEDYKDALRLSNQFLKEAGTLPAPAGELAQAELSMARTLAVRADDAGVAADTAQIDTLLHDAESLERQRLAGATEKKDQARLADILSYRRTASRDDSDLERLAEASTLYAAAVAADDARLVAARERYAAALDADRQPAQAEAQLQLNLDALKQKTGTYQAYIARRQIIALAWLKLEHGRAHEAETLIAGMGAPNDGKPAGTPLLEDEAIHITWLAARRQKHWDDELGRAQVLADQLEQVASKSKPYRRDFINSKLFAARLMLLDAKRKLGDNKGADDLASLMRDDADYPVCAGQNTQTTGAKAGFDQALGDIQGAEFKCNAHVTGTASAARVSKAASN